MTNIIIKPKKIILKLNFGFIFWEITNATIDIKIEIINSKINTWSFLFKKLFFKRLSITFAWTWTPGTVSPVGIFTVSKSPLADAPIKTYLFLKKLCSNFLSNTFSAEIKLLLIDLLYLTHIKEFLSVLNFNGLIEILLIPLSFKLVIMLLFFHQL